MSDRSKAKSPVPSWKLLPDDREPTAAELEQSQRRFQENVIRFMREPKTTYTLAEAAEIVSEAPAWTARQMRSLGFHPNAAGMYTREHVAAVALQSAPGDYADNAVLAGAVDPSFATNGAPAAQLAAIRAFFTDPKDDYTAEELVPVFGSYVGGGTAEGVREYLDLKPREKATRECAAGFLRGYVSPVVVGRAIEGLPPSPLTLRTITVSLPAWIVEALEESARAREETVSDVLACEIESGVEVGFSRHFEIQLPDYAAALRPE